MKYHTINMLVINNIDIAIEITNSINVYNKHSIQNNMFNCMHSCIYINKYITINTTICNIMCICMRNSIIH